MTAAVQSELTAPPELTALEGGEAFDADKLPHANLTRLRSVIPEHIRSPHFLKAVFYMTTCAALFAGSTAFAWWTWTEGLWYLWPVSWFIGGITFTSCFVIGHDCAHFSILKSRKWMTFWGHIFFLPTLYPFWAWKHSHDAHHQLTNNFKGDEGIYYDNAWLPLTPALYKKLKKVDPKMARIYRISRWAPFLGSFAHLVLHHFQPRKYYKADHAKKVKFSIAVLGLAFVAISAGLIWWSHNPFTIFHFWLIPAFLLQIWMSTYTYLHHTTADTKFYDQKAWTPYKGQFENTINVYFPRLLSFVHFNIDVHVPHHVLQTIPSYHLRAATEAIRNSEYGPELREEKFSFGYFFRAVRECQMWDRKKQKYMSFKEAGV